MPVPASKYREWALSTEPWACANEAERVACARMWRMVLQPLAQTNSSGGDAPRVTIPGSTGDYELYYATARAVDGRFMDNAADLSALLRDTEDFRVHHQADYDTGMSKELLEQGKRFAAVQGETVPPISTDQLLHPPDWLVEFRDCEMIEFHWYFRWVSTRADLSPVSLQSLAESTELKSFTQAFSNVRIEGRFETHQASAANRAEQRFLDQQSEWVLHHPDAQPGEEDIDIDDFNDDEQDDVGAAEISTSNKAEFRMCFQFVRPHALRKAVNYMQFVTDLSQRVAPYVLQRSEHGNPHASALDTSASAQGVQSFEAMDRVLTRPLLMQMPTSAMHTVMQNSDLRKLIIGRVDPRRTTGIVDPRRSPPALLLHAAGTDTWAVEATLDEPHPPVVFNAALAWDLTQHGWRLLHGKHWYSRTGADGLEMRWNLTQLARETWSSIVGGVLPAVQREWAELADDGSTRPASQSDIRVDWHVTTARNLFKRYDRLPRLSLATQHATLAHNWQPSRGCAHQFEHTSIKDVVEASEKIGSLYSEGAMIYHNHVVSTAEGVEHIADILQRERTWPDTLKWDVMYFVVSYNSSAQPSLDANDVHARLRREMPALFDAKRPREMFELVHEDEVAHPDSGTLRKYLLFRFLSDRFWQTLVEDPPHGLGALAQYLVQHTPELADLAQPVQPEEPMLLSLQH